MLQQIECLLFVRLVLVLVDMHRPHGMLGIDVVASWLLHFCIYVGDYVLFERFNVS